MADNANITVNMENLTNEERKQLMALIEKANKPQHNICQPSLADTYWTIAGHGRIDPFTWKNDGMDNAYYALGNCFRTQKDAEFEVERRKVLHELYVLSDGFKTTFKRVSERGCVALCYNVAHDTIGVTDTVFLFSTIYFKTRSHAQKAIDTIGIDRLKKYYFMVE